MNYKKQQRKEFIKNIIFTLGILLLAIISTYNIYYKFQEVNSVDFNSESLTVTYREQTGDQFSITKIIPVTDSVGLSSQAHLITIKNNLHEANTYKIKIIEDEELMDEILEEDKIPKEEIKISIRAGKTSTKIYNLNELEDGILLEDILEGDEEKTISIRVWIRQDTNLSSTTNMYYYGKIKVIEKDGKIAMAS